MKRQKYKTYNDLIATAGSATQLAATLGITTYAVANWERRGIPTKYWDALAEKYGASPEELYEITKHSRSNNR